MPKSNPVNIHDELSILYDLIISIFLEEFPEKKGLYLRKYKSIKDVILDIIKDSVTDGSSSVTEQEINHIHDILNIEKENLKKISINLNIYEKQKNHYEWISSKFKTYENLKNCDDETIHNIVDNNIVNLWNDYFIPIRSVNGKIYYYDTLKSKSEPDVYIVDSDYLFNSVISNSFEAQDQINKLKKDKKILLFLGVIGIIIIIIETIILVN